MTDLGQKFRLGSKIIQYRNASEDVLKAVAAILPAAVLNDTVERVGNAATDFPEGFGTEVPDVLAIDNVPADLEQAIIAISDVLMEAYQNRGNMWIDAAVLVSADGKVVLLCGASEAGKSTLTAAFAAAGWKLTTEDVAIICRDGKIPPLVRPISLRDGTADRIAQQTGTQLKVFDDRWYYDESAFLEQDFYMPLDLVILLEGVKPDEPGQLNLKMVSAEQMTRELLPCSNALRIDQGIEFLHDLLVPSPCYLMRGGTISERMLAVSSLAQKAKKMNQKLNQKFRD